MEDWFKFLPPSMKISTLHWKLGHSGKLYFGQWKYLQCTCILQELLMYPGRELQIISRWNWFWPYYFPRRGKYEINLDLSWIFDQKYYGNIERGATNMIVSKDEYPKYYSKHWPYLLATTTFRALWVKLHSKLNWKLRVYT